jgi:hypothetical protein
MLPIQNLRLAWFSADLTRSDAEKLYLSLFKQEPERSTSAKQPSQQNPFLETVGGTLDDCSVEIQRQIGRIDLLVHPLGSADDLSDGVPNLLDTQSIFEKIKLALQSSDWMPESQRVSVVASALSLANDLLDARQQFATYVGHDFEIPEASDHFFQINRKAHFGEAECNRIVQLSVVEFQKMQISLGATEKAQEVVTLYRALSIVHDFNTVPIGQVFAKTAQLAVFSSLFTEIRRALERNNLDFLKDN